MLLTDLLKKETIIPQLKGRHKKEVLEELCAAVADQKGLPKDKLLEVLLEREKLGSTGIGEGIAIPHGKSTMLKELIVACGRSEEGVDFESMDGQPTYVFFLLIAPDNTSGVHLKALAKISRLLKDPAFRQEFLAAKGIAEIYDLIASRDTTF
jgi:nitrogen PTS system EIIA component